MLPLKQKDSGFKKVGLSFFQSWSNKIRTSATKYADVMASLDFDHLALDVIGEATLGYKFNSLFSGETDVSRAFYSLIYGGNLGRRKLWRTLYKYLPSEENRRQNEATRIVRELVGKVRRRVGDRRCRYSSNN